MDEGAEHSNDMVVFFLYVSHTCAKGGKSPSEIGCENREPLKFQSEEASRSRRYQASCYRLHRTLNGVTLDCFENGRLRAVVWALRLEGDNRTGAGRGKE